MNINNNNNINTQQATDHLTTLYTIQQHQQDNDDSEDDDVDLINDEQEQEQEDDTSTSSGAGDVTIAVPGLTTLSPPPLSTTPSTSAIATTVTTHPHLPRTDIIQENRKNMPLDESRRLFQRLWTDEDEIELLQGFLDYTHDRPFQQNRDTTAFYEMVKDKLQLDFNKNQLVEKLRRLKKKYRNVLGKIGSGKEYVFKSAHDQITFDISSKIWNNEGVTVSSAPVSVAAAAVDVGRFEEDESSNPNGNFGFNLNEQNGNGVGYTGYPNSLEKKTPRSRKRVKVEEKVIQHHHQQQQQQQKQQKVETPAVTVVGVNSSSSVPSLVEETVKSCLMPLFKELLEGSTNGGNGQGRGLRGLGVGVGVGGMSMDPFTMGFGGLMNFPFGDVSDEKWRRQRILELEVFSKRLELVQDQIKSQLEELKSVKR